MIWGDAQGEPGADDSQRRSRDAHEPNSSSWWGRVRGLWRWLGAPSFDASDEEHERRARLTLSVLRLVTTAVILVTFAAFSEPNNPPQQTLVVYGPTLLVFCALIACAKRGYTAFAGWTLAWSVWVLVTFVLFFFGGLSSGDNGVAYAISVMLAGTTLGRRAGLIMAAASVVGTGAALHAETYGWIPTPLGPSLPFNTFIAITVTVLLTTIFHDMALSSVRQALHATSSALARLRAAEAENETRAMQGAALGRLGERALSSKNAVDLLRDAIDTVISLLPAERALLLLALEDSQTFRVDREASRNHDSRHGDQVSDPDSAGFGRVLKEHSCVLTTVELRSLERQLSLPPSAAALAVLVSGRLAPRGILLVMSERFHDFTAQQRQFASTIASMIGSGIERETTESLALRAQKMEAVGRLAGGVAHDFNNLLTVMVAATAELRELQLAASGVTALEDLETATQGAVLLSHQLLALSRRKPQTAQAIDLGSLVADLLAMMRRLVGKEVHMLEQLERGAPVTVLGDRAGLEQVLLNLVVNAHQAMPEGGAINVGVQSSPPGWAELRVSDTGVGMDDTTLAKIFQSFFTTKPDGTGLGLATVADVVERHGGKVTVKSSVGAGSTFTLRFPTLGSEHASAAAISSLPMPQAPQPSAATRILLVDDHELVRQIATRSLHSMGYEVVARASAQEALRELEDPKRFSLLVTDVNMPGMSGTALVEALERRGVNLPVLFISGFVDPTANGLASSARPGRRTFFLAKPFLPEQLAAAVNNCLNS
ncbi:MAG: hypothetical protein RL701_871 [Pseudomonadota bacterium]